MSKISELFSIRSEKVIPFITAGYPQKKDTLNMVIAAESAGASMVEIGMPFSDPLADGPIIQKSSQIALENGVTLKWILNLICEIRNQSEIPIALMGYVNPIIKFGLNEFLMESKDSGVDGLIIADLPPEEAGEYLSIAKKKLRIVHLTIALACSVFIRPDTILMSLSIIPVSFFILCNIFSSLF